MPNAVTIAAVLFAASALSQPMPPKPANHWKDTRDVHSYANPDEIRVRHVALDLTVDFDRRTLRGSATLQVERKSGGTLVLDSRDLKIERTEASTDGGKTFAAAPHETGAADKLLGAPLRVQVPASVTHVRVAYETSPSATGLQWLTPAQTATKAHPFLYSQSEAIHARSWIPLQDSPAVRVTYSARLRAPKELLPVMSARQLGRQAQGEYSFEMPQAIPPYLIALAVGRLEYRKLGPRTGVFAEPPVADKAAREFEDLEKMMAAAEALYGPYRWEQYDVLVLPPSFPFGGMENPRLTFVTPALLAGDKSLVGVISHELAHSWSGNLVTNATWRDFWLNEGFTTYFENRIQERVYGKERALMEAQLERAGLEEEMRDLPPADEVLYIDLKGRDPDDGFTLVAYVKGMLLLRRLEEVHGRAKWDEFLRKYFNAFAFRSITTGDFVDYLKEHLGTGGVDVAEWLDKPGLPASAPRPRSAALDRAGQNASDWIAGRTALADLPVKGWSTQEWVHFLSSLPRELPASRMAELDKAFRLTAAGNSEIRFQWLLMAIRSGYEPAYASLEEFLVGIGRRKYLKPLYQELAKTPQGLERGRAIYVKARPGYHPIAQMTVDQLLQSDKKE